MDLAAAEAKWPTMDLAAAEAKCTELRGLASTIVDSLSKRLQSQLGEPGGAGRSLDKGGAEVQSEALTISLLMSGRQADDASRAAVIEELRQHDGSEKVAAFLQYWAQLSLMAGVCAPGSGHHIQTTFVDWYRGPPGQARYMPNVAALRNDLEAFVLQGWAPETPPIRKDKLVTALGSCFADEIRIWLRRKGYRVNEDFRQGGSYPHLEDSAVPLLQCSAGLVNSFVLLQQFQWALEGRRFDDDLWVGARGQITLPTEAARQTTAAMFRETSLFVITLGLSEVWYQRRLGSMPPQSGQQAGQGSGQHGGAGAASGNAPAAQAAAAIAAASAALAAARFAAVPEAAPPAGGAARGGGALAEDDHGDVLWRAVPSDRYDPQRHGFRVTSVAENVANLREIVRLVRLHVPGASVVFTLSPVPLAATFRGVSCVTANAASKATLRVAVDELMREEEAARGRAAAAAAAADDAEAAEAVGRVYYWPAYEMVKEGFAEPYLDDGRHVKQHVVEQVLQLFGEHYLPPAGAGVVAGVGS